MDIGYIKIHMKDRVVRILSNV